MRSTAVFYVRSPSSRPSPVAAIGFLVALFVALHVLRLYPPARPWARPAAVMVRYLFFPVIILGIAIGIAAQFRPPEARRFRLQTLAWIRFLAPGVAVLAYAEKSSSLFLHYDAIRLVLPFRFAAVGLIGSYRMARGRTVSRARPASLAMAAIGRIGQVGGRQTAARVQRGNHVLPNQD